MKNEFAVFSQRIAGKLMANGHKLLRMDKKHDNTKLNVFIFDKSDELLEKVKQYQN